ncbi:multidrug DMT transporter permease [Leifsonia sp. Leaf336]|uniref:EamA family transporter n=1 Tax=Leifsonia sp. Leaf336 TaxID=1736341 RepID=UPI0006FB8E0F|nr:EamA family transporter [Leifsonia sp. Leaf336]KQR54552.1 multidrug DMT transporter permease [Leifsonia sp. Leaf336]
MSSQRNRVVVGAGTQVATEVSINFGSSVAGLLIPIVGSLVVVAVRQLVTAVCILPFYRPKRAELTWRRLWPALALGVVLAAMNLSFYEAVGRLGLGIAATIEFLGPFVLALVGSRRLLDAGCAVAAAGGVLLLTATEGAIDPIGVVLALTAAASWAAYILLTRRVATRLPGLEGLSIASVVATVLTVPLALIVVDYSRIDWRVAGLLLTAGILSSAVPYSLDTFILRRITPRLYAIITSFGPVIATLFGVLVLGEHFVFVQLVGIVVVCLAAGVSITTQRERPRSDLEATAETIP